MELQLKAFTKFSSTHCVEIGEITLLNDEFVRLKEEAYTCNYFNINHPGVLPIKRNTYTVNFLDKYHESYEGYNVSIQLKDSFLLFVKINWFQKLKLKWMMKLYPIQSEDVKKSIYSNFVSNIISGIIGVLIGFFTHFVIQEDKSDQKMPPKTTNQELLESKNLKILDK